MRSLSNATAALAKPSLELPGQQYSNKQQSQDIRIFLSVTQPTFMTPRDSLIPLPELQLHGQQIHHSKEVLPLLQNALVTPDNL